MAQEIPQTQDKAPGTDKVNGPGGDREGPLEGKVNGPGGDREGPLEGKVNGPGGDADRLLSEAFQLADQGHLDEAAQHCENLLRQQQHLTDAHFLLGLVREAAGSIEEAEQMFRKTIYLDPNHYEALTHLSVIYQQQGDAVSAQRFQRRAARAQQRSQVEEKRR
jgi:chemotaxis protein methyltransferase WspC